MISSYALLDRTPDDDEDKYHKSYPDEYYQKGPGRHYGCIECATGADKQLVGMLLGGGGKHPERRTGETLAEKLRSKRRKTWFDSLARTCHEE